MSGFITGGTILGSYLWSLIGRCVSPVPRRKKKSDTSCTLYQFSNKVKNQEKLGLAGFWAGIEEH